MVRVWFGIKQRHLLMPKEILIVDDELVAKVKELLEDTYENVSRPNAKII